MSLILEHTTILKDKVLDTWLHDTEAACLYANIFILNRAEG